MPRPTWPSPSHAPTPARRRPCAALAPLLPALIIGASALALAPTAHAQEALVSESATQPSPGNALLRSQIQWTQYRGTRTPIDGNADPEITDLTLWTSLSVGITPSVAAIARLPITWRWEDAPPGHGAHGEDSSFGAGDATLGVKIRVHRADTGPLDTWRVGLLTGLRFPTGDERFSTQSPDPFLGVATTIIRGRHGGSASAVYTLNTDGPQQRIRPGSGADDMLRLDGAYLYRLAPAAFTGDDHGATYAIIEGSAIFETNGDAELLLGPGIMYEARRWVVEAGVQLPVYQRLRDRPFTSFTAIVGVRWFF